jgi:replicative DNA helicase
LAGHELTQTLDTEALGRIQAAREQANVLEQAQTIFTGRLFAPQGVKDLEYLHKRGYTDDDMRAMGLGSIPEADELEKQLKAVNIVNNVNTKIDALQINGLGTDYTLSIPYRNAKGTLVGFITRTIGDIDPKYKYTKDLPVSHEFFNLYANRGVKSLTIVEGALDALLATARGVKGVVAVGKSKPSTKQLDHAESLKVTELTLALDNDEAGQRGALDTLKALKSYPFQAYVLTYPKGVKDADELLCLKGAAELEDLIDKSVSRANYLITCLQSKHNKHENRTDKEVRALISEVMELDYALSDPIASQELSKLLQSELGLSAELVKPLILDFYDRQSAKEREQGYAVLEKEARSLREQGKYDELEALYAAKAPGLRAKNVNTLLEPYTVELFSADLNQRNDGYQTGYAKLDEVVRIPTEAITIIAGRPAHGKTTVMLNLLFKLVELYPEQSFYFFSYEETRSQIALKLMTLIAGVRLDDYHNTRQIEHYYKTGELDDTNLYRTKPDEAKRLLDEARDYYQELVKAGRLWIIDEPLPVDDLASVIEQVAGKWGNVGGVFIDYIQKVKTTGSYPTRQVEVQKISQRLLETANKARVAIITGAQLNRNAEDKKTAYGLSLGELRESGDIEQDAHLVLGLLNSARAKVDAKEAGTSDNQVTTDLDIVVLKNRSGVTNSQIKLQLNQATLQLEDKP